MSAEQQLQLFLDWVGDRIIPDPDHCPKEFEYLLKLFRYYNQEKLNVQES